MKFRATLILVALVAGLAVFLVLFVGRQPSEPVYERQLARVFPLQEFQEKHYEDPVRPSAMMTRLELRVGENRIVLTRTGDSEANPWRIVHPIRTAADSAEVLSILIELELLSAQAALRDEPDRRLDPGLYGLDRPECSVSFGTGKRSWALDIGEMTADGKSIYVARPDIAEPTVYVVPRKLLDSVTKQVADLRDKAVLRFGRSRVSGIEFRRRGEESIVCSRQKGQWRITAPVRDCADGYVINLVLDALLHLRVNARDFITDDGTRAPEFGLDNPSFKAVVFEDGADAGRGLLLGSPAADREGKVYAKREGEPSIFVLRERAVEGIRKSLGDVRARNVLQFEPDDVSELDISIPGQTLRLVKDGAAWQMKQPAGVEADRVQVRNFLDDLRSLAVQKWLDDPTSETIAESGLVQPRAVVGLTMKEGKRRQEILFGKTLDGRGLCHARRGDEGPVLLVPSEIIENLSLGPLAFVSRVMLEFGRGEVSAILITRPDGEFHLEKRADEWACLEPQGAEVQAAAVDSLLWELCHLEAKRIIGERAEKSVKYELDAPRIRVTISLGAAPARREILQVGKERDETASYAIVEGKSLVYLIGKSTVDLLMAPLVKPSL